MGSKCIGAYTRASDRRAPVSQRAAKGLALLCLLLAGAWASGTRADPAPPCGTRGVAVQVLGSGGPELQEGRASSGYLVWRDGRPLVLVDVGGGTALRFGEAGAHVAGLAAILLTQLHADHASDLAALVKASYFESRSRRLPVYGPGGSERFPSTRTFVRDLFGAKAGAYRYLAAYVLGSPPEGYALVAHDLTGAPAASLGVLDDGDLHVRAVAVHHGDVPALAYRVELAGATVTFTGDTDGGAPALARLATGSDLLVAHHAIAEDASGAVRDLHMPPSVIGRLAADADVGRVLLAHRMVRTRGREAASLAAIREHYAGRVDFAEDLDCVVLR